MLTPIRRTLVAAAVVAGCAGEGPRPSIDAFVLVNRADGVSRIERVSLPVTNARTLDNELFAPEAHTSVDVDPRFSADGTLAYDVRTEGGTSMDLSLVESDGAYAATDYDALVALSTTHHLFASRQHFDALGLDRVVPVLPKFKVFFFPSRIAVNVGLGQDIVEDNAFFSKPIGGFGILRQNVLDSLPLSVNLGVIAHEFSHAVFETLTSAEPVYNILFADFNEGLADVHGAAVTGDPAFLGRSVAAVGASRDLSVPRRYSAAEYTRNGTNPYWYGAIIASIFWSYRSRLVAAGIDEAEARSRMARVAFEGLRDVRTPTPIPDPKVQPGREPYEAVLWRSFATRAEALGDRAAFCAPVVEALDEIPGARAAGCP